MFAASLHRMRVHATDLSAALRSYAGRREERDELAFRVAGIHADAVSLIRGTSLSGFPVLVERLGGCPAELLRRRRIPEAAVGDFESFIDYACLLEVLEDAARDTGTPTFGRLLAQVQGIEILGSVGAAARTAPTVGDAMVTFTRYLGAYSPAIEVRLTPRDDRPGLTTFEFRILLQRLPPHPQGIELALGV